MSLPLIAEINADNLIYNALKIKKLIGDKTKFCAVVKSNAYGHGLAEIACILYPIVDFYAVALSEEALRLRLSGIDKPILLLTPIFKENVEILVERNITLSVSSIEELKLINKATELLKKTVDVHFALNTGMNRLGMNDIQEINKCLEYVKKHKHIKLCGVFSHFCDAENKKYSDFQFKKFLYFTEPLKQFNKNIILHISASGGLLKNSNYHLDMVRVGLLLYGYKPFKSNLIKLKPVMTIKARVVLSRKELKGKKLLYGNYRCKADSVDILRMGYGDGFFRKGDIFTLNNLCMDLCAVKNDGKNIKERIIMKNALSLAEKYDTIPYEILTSVTKRAEINVIYKNTGKK